MSWAWARWAALLPIIWLHTAGAWMSSLTHELQLTLSIERQVLCWFEPDCQPELFHPARCPIFILEYAPSRFCYGFPNLGDGVKAAIHHEGENTRPETIRREVRPEDAEAVRALLARFMPGAAGPLQSAVVCMYTNAPDSHFILGHHPACPQVVIASPCSGPGFKFCPVIGEIAATLIEDGVPPFDLSLFTSNRFAAPTTASGRKNSGCGEAEAV